MPISTQNLFLYLFCSFEERSIILQRLEVSVSCRTLSQPQRSSFTKSAGVHPGYFSATEPQRQTRHPPSSARHLWVLCAGDLTSMAWLWSTRQKSIASVLTSPWVKQWPGSRWDPRVVEAASNWQVLQSSTNEQGRSTIMPVRSALRPSLAPIRLLGCCHDSL